MFQFFCYMVFDIADSRDSIVPYKIGPTILKSILKSHHPVGWHTEQMKEEPQSFSSASSLSDANK